MRRWLQLTRAHTAPLETVPAVVGALLATNGEITQGVLLWGVAGLMYHLSGYGMNSYEDWNGGFDKEDPFKQHHPLNSGEIDPDEAKSFVYVFLVATVVYTYWLALFYGHYTASIVITIGLVGGVAYNYIGKYTEHKYIFISIAHTSMFIAPYVSLGGDNPIVIILGGALVFNWVVYQIAVSGEIKDIVTDEANFLKDRFGVKVDVEKSYNLDVVSEESYVYDTHDAQVYGGSLRLAIGVFGVLLALHFGSVSAAALVALISAVSIYISSEMLQSGEYRRGMRIQDMSMIEICSMGVLLASTLPVIGLDIALTLFIGSGLWVVSMNLYMWGTVIAPEV